MLSQNVRELYRRLTERLRILVQSEQPKGGSGIHRTEAQAEGNRVKHAETDKHVQCAFCGKVKKESASIYLVSTDSYYCSQRCIDLQARFEDKGGK